MMTNYLRNIKVTFAVILLVSISGSAHARSTPSDSSRMGTISRIEIEPARTVLTNVPFEMTINAFDEHGNKAASFSGPGKLAGPDTQQAGSDSIHFVSGTAHVSNMLARRSGLQLFTVEIGNLVFEQEVRVIPAFLSILPPLVAIALAFAARQVLISLFCGIWLGAILINDYNIISGFLRTVDNYIVNALSDPGQAAILIFSLTLGGMVGVISRSGGTQGIVDKIAKRANSSRGGQLSTWAMGLLIFFDDYANTLIVGNTMRPFTDRLKISREKLSYLVDSTAAPVASIALVSTWIGFQVGLIDQAFSGLGIQENAYNAFLQSIPHSTYSILALIFVLLVATTLKDFGPMRDAEERARKDGKVLRDGAQPIADSAALDSVAPEGTPKRWYNAIIPIGVVILVTFIGLYVDGKNELGAAAASQSLGQIFGAARSTNILMWASFTGLFVGAILALSQRILTLNEVVKAAVDGYKSMFMAAMILVLAWSIGDICKSLNTAGYVIELTKGILSPHLIPVFTFLIAAFISFSTGSSWATMAILTPIVVPIAAHLPADAGLAPGLNHEILVGTIGSILSGSVLGDHCSPISDTTILSSMASAADHVDHVRTQLPYALLVGAVACIVGYIPNGWGLNTAISIGLGISILVLLINFLGKKTEVDAQAAG